MAKFEVRALVRIYIEAADVREALTIAQSLEFWEFAKERTPNYEAIVDPYTIHDPEAGDLLAEIG